MTDDFDALKQIMEAVHSDLIRCANQNTRYELAINLIDRSTKYLQSKTCDDILNIAKRASYQPLVVAEYFNICLQSLDGFDSNELWNASDRWLFCQDVYSIEVSLRLDTVICKNGGILAKIFKRMRVKEIIKNYEHLGDVAAKHL